MFSPLSRMLNFTESYMSCFNRYVSLFYPLRIPTLSSLYHAHYYNFVVPAEMLSLCWGHPSVFPIVTSQMLLFQHCDVIVNNSIGNNAAIPLVDWYKLLMNINEWIAHVKKKTFYHNPQNHWFAQGHAWWYIDYCDNTRWRCPNFVTDLMIKSKARGGSLLIRWFR